MVGLPKSGTTSIHDALRRLHIKSAHFSVPARFCNYPINEVTVGGNSTKATIWHEVDFSDEPRVSCYVGAVVQSNIAQKLDPMHSLIESGYRAFAQVDVCYPSFNLNIWPQLDALEEIVEAYPDAYYIHTRRVEVEAHVASIEAWHKMLDRFKDAGMLHKYIPDDFKIYHNKTDFELGVIFVKAANTFTAEFFAHRPYLKFLDIYIEDKNAAAKLGHFLGIENFELLHDNTGHYTKKYTAAPTPTTLYQPPPPNTGDDDEEDDDEGATNEPADDDEDDGGPGKISSLKKNKLEKEKKSLPQPYHDDH